MAVSSGHDGVQKAAEGQKGAKGDTLVAGSCTKPLEHAFVVQFRQSTESEPDWFSGRVEHMMSGQFASFESTRELKAFFRRVLNQQLSASQGKAGSRDGGT